MNRKWMAGALLTAGIGVGLAAGVAQADPYGHVGGNCPAGHTRGKWCPGERVPDNFISWDMGVCHLYYYDYRGVVDADTGAVYGWPSGPIPPPRGRRPGRRTSTAACSGARCPRTRDPAHVMSAADLGTRRAGPVRRIERTAH